MRKDRFQKLLVRHCDQRVLLIYFALKEERHRFLGILEIY